MRDQFVELQSELDEVAAKLFRAQRELRKLQRGRSLSRNWSAILSIAALVTLSLASWTAFAKKPQPGYAIRAPFKVIDKYKKPIFAVEAGSAQLPRGVYLSNAAGTTIARMYLLGGGHIKVMSETNEKDAAVMAASDITGLGLSLLNNDEPRVFMGEERKGSVQTDHGIVSVFAESRPLAVAALTVIGRRGTVAVFDTTGKPIAHLAESDKESGAGRVTVSNSKNEGTFSAGGTKDSGEACRSRGRALECLAPDLPLSIHKTRK